MFFFSLGQKRVENTFSSLLDVDGTEKYSQADIELILINFYRSLFSKDILDMQLWEELIYDLDTCLTDYEHDLCEGLFMKEELFTALLGLQTGKSGGSDGLPPGFYSAFWDDLSDSLLSVLNECYNTGSLNLSQCQALLHLFYKKVDRPLPKNWHPISLMNTDYKLASKIITKRLKKVMTSIVHLDQMCGVVGSCIFAN